MNIKEALAGWGLNAVALLAGTIGAVLKLTISDKEISFRSAIAQLVGSMAFAGYGTEWLVRWLHMEQNASACGLLGLCLGICGLFAARGVVKWGKRFESNPDSFISNKGGQSNDTASN